MKKRLKCLASDRPEFLICLSVLVLMSIIFSPIQANATVNQFKFNTTNVVYQSAIGNNGANIGYAVTATNNGVPVSTISCNPISSSLFPIGNTPVICATTDSQGNTGIASFNISVNGADSTSPTITPPANITASQSGTFTNVTLGTPTVTDNADLSPLVTNDHPIAGFKSGVTLVTWTATDHSGNSKTAIQKVTIASFAQLTVTATPPGSAIPYKTIQAVTLSSSDPTNIYYTIDGNPPTISSAIYKNPIPVNSNMTIKFFGVFSNGTSGPVATAAYTIDTIAPVITRNGPSPVTVQQGSSYSDAGATATDNVDGIITSKIATGGLPINTSVPGTYPVTYNVSDKAGNAAAQVTRTVLVVGTGSTTNIMSDTVASSGQPLYSAKQIHAEFVSPTSALVGKNIDTIVVKLKKTGVPAGTATIGVFNTDLSVKKSFGTMDVSTLTTSSVDYTFSLPTGQTYQIASGDRIGIKFTGGDSTNRASVMTDKTNAFDGTNTYRTQYTTAWNDVQAEDLYMILKLSTGSTTGGDTTPPVITLTGSPTVTVQHGSTYSDAGATAIDNLDGIITPSIATSNPVNTSILGTYTVTYNVSDQAGNAATQVTRTVKVVDTVSPTVSAVPPGNLYNSIQSVILTASEPSTIYYTMDGSAPTISSQVYNGPVSINSDKIFKFFAKDIEGNSGPVASPVSYAIDTISPVITLRGTTQVSLEVFSTYHDAGATANDNRDGNITSSIITSNPVNTSILGTYTVTYNVSDQAGNAATQVTRVVNVVDTTPPVITMRGSPTVTIQHGSTYSDAGATAIDNLDGNITSSIITHNPVDTSVLTGTFTVTYDVSDQAGNAAAEVTRTVNVGTPDAIPPTLSIVSPLNNTSISTPTVPVSGTASDNSLVVQSVKWKVDNGLVSTAGGTTTNWSFTTASLSVGPHTISVNATDPSGNVASKHIGITITSGTTSPIMSDTIASGGQPLYSGRQVHAEYASPTSVLVGKNMNSILLELKKTGTVTGTATIGVFNADLSVKKSFGTMDVSTLTTSSVDYTFSLPTGQTYQIASGDRIGIKFTGGDSINRVSVMTDKTNAFDGTNTYRTQYTTAWNDVQAEDLYMILK